jgi:MFS family permease
MGESAHPIRILAVLSYSVICFTLGQTMLVAALPELVVSLHTNEADIAWTLTAFFVASAIAGPILGRLADMFGKRRMAMVATGLFGLGSVVSASTDNLWVVVAGRAMQGAGATVSILAFSLARDLLPERLRARGIGVISGIAAGGGAIGIVLGGIIVEHLSWRWLFWLTAIVAATATAALLAIPESPVKSGGRVDYRGAAVLTVGLALPLIGISRAARWSWTDWRVLALILAGLVILAAWVRLEERTPEPLANIALLRSRSVLVINTCSLLVGYVIIVAYVIVPQLAQAPDSTGYGFGFSAVGGGLLLVPGGIGLIVAGPLAGGLGARLGVRAGIAAAATAGAAGYILLAFAHETTLGVIVFTCVAVLGAGFAFVVNINALIDVTPPALTGEATGMNTVLVRTGMALGSQVTGTLLVSSAVNATGLPGDSGYTRSFLLAGLLALLSVALAFLVPARTGKAALAPVPAAAGSDDP